MSIQEKIRQALESNATTLDLSYSDLTGLPSLIFECDELRSLDLRENRLTLEDIKYLSFRLPKCFIKSDY